LPKLHANILNESAHNLVQYKIQQYIILHQYYFLQLTWSMKLAFHWIHPTVLHLSCNLCFM